MLFLGLRRLDFDRWLLRFDNNALGPLRVHDKSRDKRQRGGGAGDSPRMIVRVIVGNSRRTPRFGLRLGAEFFDPFAALAQTFTHIRFRFHWSVIHDSS